MENFSESTVNHSLWGNAKGGAHDATAANGRLVIHNAIKTPDAHGVVVVKADVAGQTNINKTLWPVNDHYNDKRNKIKSAVEAFDGKKMYTTVDGQTRMVGIDSKGLPIELRVDPVSGDVHSFYPLHADDFSTYKTQ